jgi:hypothetical protein
MSGVGKIDAEAGQMDFAVSFDSKKVKSEDLVKALVGAGYDKAKVVKP